MKNVLPLFASLLFVAAGLLAQDCPTGVTEEHRYTIGCGPEFSPEDLALVAEAVVEVDVVAAHPYLGPRGAVRTRYEVEAVNVFKGPSALQKGTKFAVDRYGGKLQVDCRLIDHYTNSARLIPGERWLLSLYRTESGYLDAYDDDGMWKVNGNGVERFYPEKRMSRQELISKITSSLESTKALTWDQVQSITAIAEPEKSIPLIRQRGVGFVMTYEMRQQILGDGKFGRAEVVEAIETSLR